ncbi:hypothetical protein F503_00402 [Ophiostoma piceae UAMH 11346]|uniref:Uncharacterized protein n=1 Tax=Ophiostoma piceae (strain UAMH 11346) TaxID=1262450 RepID=S3D316_OPHP1|nr:hypothetical protein F503_00402 [Ophiostoma piceae UAMH 11346]
MACVVACVDRMSLELGNSSAWWWSPPSAQISRSSSVFRAGSKLGKESYLGGESNQWSDNALTDVPTSGWERHPATSGPRILRLTWKEPPLWMAPPAMLKLVPSAKSSRHDVVYGSGLALWLDFERKRGGPFISVLAATSAAAPRSEMKCFTVDGSGPARM